MDSTKPEIIYLIARWNGNRFRYPSGFSVLPKNWNVKAGEVRNVISEPNREAINQTLKGLRAAVFACYAENTAQNSPITAEALRLYLDTYTNRIIQPDRSFWGFMDAFMREAPTKIQPNGKTLGRRQIQKYNTTISILKEFEKEHRAQLDFPLFGSADFRPDLIEFLTRKKGFAVNTIASYLGTFKSFLAAAIDAGITDLQPAKAKAFKIKEEEATTIYLTESDLAKLRALDLSHTARLEKARDLFLIGCYTGLRVSDFKTLQAHNIKSDTIEIYQKKTGGKVTIPIRPALRLLLEKYAVSGLPALSDQKLNEYIKEVGKAAGICEMVENRRTVAGKLEVEILPKYSLITSHTARRSFATNEYKNGVPARSIMAVTGHKTEKAFQKYIRLAGEEHAQIMASKWQAAPVAE